jgi:hypothetical protein
MRVMHTARKKNLFRMALVPATIRLQCGQMVNLEKIIPPQEGQFKVVFCSTAVPRRERLRFNSEWISYRPLQSGIGHLPVAGMSSVQRKDLLHSGHSIFNIRLLRRKNDCEIPYYTNSLVSYHLVGGNYR